MIPRVNGIPMPSSERGQPHSSARLFPIGADYCARKPLNRKGPPLAGFFFCEEAILKIDRRRRCAKQQERQGKSAPSAAPRLSAIADCSPGSPIVAH